MPPAVAIKKPPPQIEWQAGKLEHTFACLHQLVPLLRRRRRQAALAATDSQALGSKTAPRLAMINGPPPPVAPTRAALTVRINLAGQRV